MNEAELLSLEALAGRFGLPVRTVRYYIQLGLVDRPEGAGRAARYGPRHVEQLVLVQSLQRKGMSLEEIAEFTRSDAPRGGKALPRTAGDVEVWSRLFIDDGLELHVEPGRAGLSPEQVRSLFRGMVQLVERVRRNDK